MQPKDTPTVVRDRNISTSFLDIRLIHPHIHQITDTFIVLHNSRHYLCFLFRVPFWNHSALRLLLRRSVSHSSLSKGARTQRAQVAHCKCGVTLEEICQVVYHTILGYKNCEWELADGKYNEETM